MKNKNLQFLLAFAITGAVAYFVYKRYIRKIKGVENFNLLAKNVPEVKVAIETSELTLPNGNLVNFFKNNRFFIYDNKTKDKKMLTYGYYLNGGELLISDNGKQKIRGRNVIKNLTKAIEKF